jgi:hypothetical protein
MEARGLGKVSVFKAEADEFLFPAGMGECPRVQGAVWRDEVRAVEVCAPLLGKEGRVLPEPVAMKEVAVGFHDRPAHGRSKAQCSRAQAAVDHGFEREPSRQVAGSVTVFHAVDMNL